MQADLDSDSESGSEMEFTETKIGTTFLVFDTNAYLTILPYCRAVLESDKLKVRRFTSTLMRIPRSSGLIRIVS